MAASCRRRLPTVGPDASAVGRSALRMWRPTSSRRTERESGMATLAGQRAQFTWALNQYNRTEDVDERAKFAKRTAKYISTAPANGFTVEEVTQGQSYPAAEVAKYLNGDGDVTGDAEISEEKAIQSLEGVVDTSDVIRDGQGSGTLYVYGYRCAPDR